MSSDIRVERDPAFWGPILNHPAVRGPTLHGHPFEAILPLLAEPHLPLASVHGGYLLRNLDGLGRVWDLHAAFTPNGWGHEARNAGLALYDCVFGSGAQLILLTEQRAFQRSRGCLSHGWRPAGGFYVSQFGELRQWLLTEAMWRASPVHRRRA